MAKHYSTIWGRQSGRRAAAQMEQLVRELHEGENRVAKRNYIYVAGPYLGNNVHHNHHSYFRIHENIAKAQEASFVLASLGYGFFCPHTHSAHNEVIAPHLPVEYWYELDNYFLRMCDAVLVLPGESKGVQAEIFLAAIIGIPVFYSMVDLVNGIKPFEEARKPQPPPSSPEEQEELP